MSITRRTFLGLCGGGLAVAIPVASASETAAFEVIQEKPGGSNGACGPYALANALVNGDPVCQRAFRRLPGANSVDRAEALIRQYGVKPSETYGPRRGRFLNGAGLTCPDMPFLANDFLAAANATKVGGAWLDHLAGEDEHGHLQRLHRLMAGSLARGFPPVVEVRAFAADTAASKPAWVNLYAHWLALVSLEPTNLESGVSGFLCRFADSFTGRAITGFAHVELNRPYMATRGFTLKADGTQDWHWLGGHPYILVEVPDLPLLIPTRPWQNRTVTVVTYMVGRSKE